MSDVRCPDCREFWKSHGQDPDGPLSRADAEYVHYRHRPMHPNHVGGARRAEAREAWNAWLELTPGREVGDEAGVQR